MLWKITCTIVTDHEYTCPFFCWVFFRLWLFVRDESIVCYSGLMWLGIFFVFLFMFTAKWDNAIDYGWTINRISTDIAAEWTFQMTEATSTEYMAPPLLLQYKSILVQPLPILPCVDSKFRLLSNVEVAGGQRGGLHFEGWIMTLLCLPWSKSVNWSLSEGSLWCATFFLFFFFAHRPFYFHQSIPSTI